MQLFDLQLERLKKASGVTSDTAFAGFLGISQGSISGAKKKMLIPHAWFFQVSDKTGVSSDWLFFGRGLMYPSDVVAQTETPPQTTEVPSVEAKEGVWYAKLEKKLDALEAERRELVLENRRLWKENGDLRERCARLEGQQKFCNIREVS